MMEKQLVLLLMILNHLFILNYHHQLIGDKKIGGQPKVQKIMDYLNFILGDLKPVKNRTIL